MTDQQLKECIEAARRATNGPHHGLWDVISDAECILANKPSIMTRTQVETYLRPYLPPRHVGEYVVLITCIAAVVIALLYKLWFSPPQLF